MTCELMTTCAWQWLTMVYSYGGYNLYLKRFLHEPRPWFSVSSEEKFFSSEEPNHFF